MTQATDRVLSLSIDLCPSVTWQVTLVLFRRRALTRRVERNHETRGLGYDRADSYQGLLEQMRLAGPSTPLFPIHNTAFHYKRDFL
jgi:hypothetical protein